MKFLYLKINAWTKIAASHPADEQTWTLAAINSSGMNPIDFTNFWDNSEYALKDFVSEPPTPELISSIEIELGYKLPAFYVEMMQIQNGGIPFATCFPVSNMNSEFYDIDIFGIYGIGRVKPYSLCGRLGNRHMITEWGYPDIGICICSTPSAGHDIIMLDYRKCGSNGEPEVIHISQEDDYAITFLAESFEKFISRLVRTQ